MAIKYHIGDKPRVTGTFTAKNGSPVDPSAVTAWYQKKGEAVTTLVYGTDAELVKEGTGVYSFHMNLTKAGHWYYGITGTGANQAANEDKLYVQPSYQQPA